LLCRRLLLNRLSAQARHWCWLLVLASLLLPVGFGVPIESMPVSQPAPQLPAVNVSEPFVAVEEQSFQATSITASATDLLLSAENPSRNLPIQSWMILLWAGTALVFCVVPLWNLHRYRRIAAQARPVPDAAARLLHRCQAQMGTRRTVKLLESGAVIAPVLLGWWRPTLLLPVGLQARLGETQLRHVFLHELAHVQRHDICTNWLATLAQVLHWFNPVVWLALRVMRSDMEQACDAKALGLLAAREHADYGRTLIGVMDHFPGRAPAHGLGVVDGREQLKERIMMIAKFKSRKLRSPALAAVMLAGLTSVAVTQPRIEQQVAQQVPGGAPQRLQQPALPVRAIPVMQQGAAAQQAVTPQGQRATQSQAETASHVLPPSPSGVTMEELIEQVSKNIQKKIIRDPRVMGRVSLYGQKLDEIDYPGFLTILRVNDFTAVEVNGYISVVPLTVVRTLATPVVVDGRSYPEDQFVSGRISLANACAMSIAASMRVLIAQSGYLTADKGSNSILLFDTFANYKRIGAMIRDLDASSTPGEKCNGPPTPSTSG
jgi:beta-lactamase regulating signal transducer with metallopeptidase domain